MLINARPRFVSNGYETFVPVQRAESLHQRLVEMTNNNVNAWSTSRSVATLPNESWDQQLDDFGSNENFPAQTLYSEYFQGNANPAYNQAFNLQKTPVYTVLPQYQYQTFKKPSASQQMYHEPMPDMSCFDQQSPMLGNDYSECNFRHRNGSFAEFSNTRNGMKDFQYRTSTETELTPYASSLALAPHHTYEGYMPGTTEQLNMNMTSPSTVYTDYSSSGPSIDPLSLVSSNTSNSRDLSMKNSSWPDASASNRAQHQTYDAQFSHHGLPSTNDHQQIQPYGDLWNTGASNTNSWAGEAQHVAPTTISPKVLTLNVHLAPLSSNGSSQGSVRDYSSSRSTPSSSSYSGSGSGEDYADYAAPESLKVEEPIHRSRQILPDSIPSVRRANQVLPSNDFPRERATRKRPLRSTDVRRRAKASPPYIEDVPTPASSSRSTKTEAPQYSAPKRIEPKPASPGSQQAWSETPAPATVQATHHRDIKDDFLVKSKLAGMSYKDIRRQGKFTEAESTLRGRFRTLTKHKTARVRKPEWDENDICLLKKAVRKLTPGSDPSRGKVPWKLVAEYIANHGGSYHFGNATCRKRWDDLQARC